MKIPTRRDNLLILQQEEKIDLKDLQQDKTTITNLLKEFTTRQDDLPILQQDETTITNSLQICNKTRLQQD